MAKKGEQQEHPAKQFRVPADMTPLKNFGTMIVNVMRSTFHWRMTEGQKSIGSGRSVQSKRGKPARKKK